MIWEVYRALLWNGPMSPKSQRALPSGFDRMPTQEGAHCWAQGCNYRSLSTGDSSCPAGMRWQTITAAFWRSDVSESWLPYAINPFFMRVNAW